MCREEIEKIGEASVGETRPVVLGLKLAGALLFFLEPRGSQ
jgi:hypothetical protein